MRDSIQVVVLGFLFVTPCRAEEPTPDVDLSGDRYVDETDLLIFLDQWHTGQKPTATNTLVPKSTATPSHTSTFTQLPSTQTATPTPHVQPTETPGPGLPEITINLPNLPAGAKPLTVVRIPAGSYQMGAHEDPSSDWTESDEYPLHWVNIAYDFYVGKWEVTQAQWVAVMGGSNPAHDNGVGNDYPVYCVSWDDIRGPNGFLDRLNALGQGTFRLPSEAEWEYACRAGTTTRFSFGDSDCERTGCTSCELDAYAWWCGNNSPSGAKEVGQKLGNGFGLFDMHGNVWEWCEDDWHSTYTGAPTNGDARIDSPSRGSYRLIRGGLWKYPAGACHSAERAIGPPDYPFIYIGFRLLREAP